MVEVDVKWSFKTNSGATGVTNMSEVFNSQQKNVPVVVKAE